MTKEHTEKINNFQGDIDDYESELNIELQHYKLCYEYFNIDPNTLTSNNRCKQLKTGFEDCSDCLKKSEDNIVRLLDNIQNVQDDIINEIKELTADYNIPPNFTEEYKNELRDIVKRYKNTGETFVESVELYKLYRIRIISEVIKLLVILFIIFYLLKTTEGVKTMTFVSSILYITLSSLEAFYPSYALFIFSMLSYSMFVIFAIMNINDISINYQNLANKTADTISNVSTEFKKDVNVL